MCRARLVEGSITQMIPQTTLSQEEIEKGYFLPCCCSADTDCLVEAELFDELRDIVVRTLPCRVDDVRVLSPDIVQVWLRLPPRANFHSVPGQYVDVIRSGDLRRSYSIANHRGPNDRIELHIRRFDGGRMSAYWFDEARAGDLLRLEGPFGTFILRDPVELSGADLVFLATGTGYAPIKAMIEQLGTIGGFFARNRVWLFRGGRSEQDHYLPVGGDERLASEFVASGASAPDAKRYVQHAAAARLPSLENALVFACGSDRMIHSAKQHLVSRGLEARRFHYEAFVDSGSV